MDLGELRADMYERFEYVDQRFAQVDERFDQVDRRFDQVDRRFAEIDRRFALVDQRFARVDERFQELIDLILFEGAKTRRHFDVIAEQMKSERNVAIDKAVAVDERTGRLTASNAADHVEFSTRLDDHEARLAQLEQKPRGK